MDIPIDGSKYILDSFDSPSLRITNLQKTDSGTYRCGATNFLGTSYSYGIDVNVTGGMNILVQPTLYVKYHTSMCEINVKVTGSMYSCTRLHPKLTTFDIISYYTISILRVPL